MLHEAIILLFSKDWAAEVILEGTQAETTTDNDDDRGKNVNATEKIKCADDSGVFKGWVDVPPSSYMAASNNGSPNSFPLIDYIRHCYGDCSVQELQVCFVFTFKIKDSLIIDCRSSWEISWNAEE